MRVRPLVLPLVEIVDDRMLPCGVQVYPEGTHLMVPWLERPIIYDVRAQPNVVQSTSGSRDLQMVRVAVANLWCLHHRGCGGGVA